MKKKESLNLLKIDLIEDLTPDERREHLLNLSNLGMSERDIGKALNKSHSTIHDWLNPSRGYDRKREKKLNQVLEDFKRYMLNNINFCETQHLKTIKEIIINLEDIKNKLEVKKAHA